MRWGGSVGTACRAFQRCTRSSFPVNTQPGGAGCFGEPRFERQLCDTRELRLWTLPKVDGKTEAVQTKMYRYVALVTGQRGSSTARRSTETKPCERQVLKYSCVSVQIWILFTNFFLSKIQYFNRCHKRKVILYIHYLVPMKHYTYESETHLSSLCIISSLSSLSVNTFHQNSLSKSLWRTLPLGTSGFKALPVFCLLLLVCVYRFNAKPTHVRQENKTLNFPSSMFKAPFPYRGAVYAQIFTFQIWLRRDPVWTRIPQRASTNQHWRLCSAVVGTTAQTYTQWCGGNAIKELDACKAKQPRAQNWFTD